MVDRGDGPHVGRNQPPFFILPNGDRPTATQLPNSDIALLNQLWNLGIDPFAYFQQMIIMQQDDNIFVDGENNGNNRGTNEDSDSSEDQEENFVFGESLDQLFSRSDSVFFNSLPFLLLFLLLALLALIFLDLCCLCLYAPHLFPWGCPAEALGRFETLYLLCQAR